MKRLILTGIIAGTLLVGGIATLFSGVNKDSTVVYEDEYTSTKIGFVTVVRDSFDGEFITLEF